MGPGAWVAVALDLAVAGTLAAAAVQAAPARWQQVDRSNDALASDWTSTALSLFEPNAVVLSWWSYSTALWYTQLVEGLRPDVWIVDDRTRLDEHLGDVGDVIDAQLGLRPVYLIRLDPGELAELAIRYQLEVIDTLTGQQILHVLGRLAP